MKPKQNNQLSLRLSRPRIVLLGSLVVLLPFVALLVSRSSRWRAIDARHLPPAEIDGIGSAVRAWYWSEAWNSALRHDFRSACLWAQRSATVNLLKITAEEDTVVLAEVGWLQGGVTNLDLTLGVSKSENRWLVIGAAW